jgi:hypothetical protein
MTKQYVLIHRRRFWWNRGAAEPESSCLEAGNQLHELPEHERSQEKKKEGEGAGRRRKGAKEWGRGQNPEGRWRSRRESQHHVTSPREGVPRWIWLLNFVLYSFCWRYLQWVQRSSVRVERSSVGSAQACCMAGPRSNLGSAPEEMKRGFGEWRWMNELYECDYKCIKLKKIK